MNTDKIKQLAVYHDENDKFMPMDPKTILELLERLEKAESSNSWLGSLVDYRGKIIQEWKEKW
jgi:hypothetical protein